MSGLLGHVAPSAGPPGWAVGFRKRQRFWERPAELLTELMRGGFAYFRKPSFRSWLFQRCVNGGFKLAGDDGSWMEGGLAASRTRTQRVLLSLIQEKYRMWDACQKLSALGMHWGSTQKRSHQP